MSDLVPKIAELLHQKNGQLHTSQEVESLQSKLVKRGSESISNKPLVKIESYLKWLERTYTKSVNYPRVLEKIKNVMHALYVIKPDQVLESVLS